MGLSIGDDGLRDLDGHKGFLWGLESSDTLASVPVAGSKIQTALSDSSQVTLELVVAIADGITPFGSALTYLGTTGDYGRLDLRFTPPQTLQFYWKNQLVQSWKAFVQERCVLHVVIDTSETSAPDRVRMYRNGSLLTPYDGANPSPVDLPVNDRITIEANDRYVLGNRSTGDRSPRGVMYYSALYAAALNANDVAANAALLLLDDDH
ncbi:Hypothetical protein CAP_2057 [Chondromyces apiculatus DSM 436]|uniref:Uncharacterized protein n=1 Tax=Chondromyces apiculatus DSM 436 TaxID=1192034 RepID=A0A017ST67_9BACT|nr:Hypothetical protein CAP_2057 [Chondromyces apiculatus DSM 436]